MILYNMCFMLWLIDQNNWILNQPQRSNNSRIEQCKLDSCEYTINSGEKEQQYFTICKYTLRKLRKTGAK